MAQAIGRIAKDAKVKTAENGKEFMVFTVAENFPYKDKDGNRKQNTTYFNCAFWRSTKLAPYLVKGTIVVITGQISARPFTDREGNKQASVNMRVNEISLQGGNPKKGAETAKSKPQPAAAGAEANPDDLPF